MTVLQPLLHFICPWKQVGPLEWACSLVRYFQGSLQIMLDISKTNKAISLFSPLLKTKATKQCAWRVYMDDPRREETGLCTCSCSWDFTFTSMSRSIWQILWENSDHLFKGNVNSMHICESVLSKPGLVQCLVNASFKSIDRPRILLFVKVSPFSNLSKLYFLVTFPGILVN